MKETELDNLIENFTNSHELSGFDSQEKLAIVMEASQNFAVKEKCPECNKKIDGYKFSKEFTLAYNDYTRTCSKNIARRLISSKISVVRRSIRSAITNLVRLGNSLRKFMCTNPEKLNHRDSFKSYYISDDRIYHIECYAKKQRKNGNKTKDKEVISKSCSHTHH